MVALPGRIGIGMPSAVNALSREKVKVIVGGAPVSSEWASEIGADSYGADANEAAVQVLKLVGSAS